MSDLHQRIANLSPKQRALLERRLQRQRAQPIPEHIIQKRELSQLFPLSFAQQRLWFLDQLDLPPALYIMARAIRLKGMLNIEALQQSLDILITRHQALRSTVMSVEGHPLQRVNEPRSSPLIITQQPVQSDPELATKLHAGLQQPFDLSQDLMLRATLLSFSVVDHVFVIHVHHIACDAWSIGILYRELEVLYTAISTGTPNPLPDLPIQYGDYVRWQQNEVQPDILTTHLAYWRHQLNGAPRLHNFPTDRPRPAVQTYLGHTLPLTISSDLLQKLTALGQQEGVTLFTILFTAWIILTHRYTGQDDIVIGSPVAGRPHAETETLIGLFINTIVLRAQLEPDLSCRDLLQQNSRVVIDALSHQAVPFEKVVEELVPERNLSYSPLFQVMFTFQNVPQRAFTLPGLTAEPLHVDPGTARFDITLTLTQGEGTLQGSLEYNSDLFDTATITRVLGHWQTLLQGIIDDPDRAVSQLPILSKAEKAQLLADRAIAASPYPQHACVHHLIEQQVQRTPHAIAVEDDSGSLTYTELNQRANQLAHHLRDLGTQPELPVALCVTRSRDMVVSLLGILKTGSPYVPLDSTYPSERLRFMIEDSQASIVVTDIHVGQTLPPHQARVVHIDNLMRTCRHEPTHNPTPSITPEHLAYIIYTSGSTGRPKGVQIPHRGLVNFLCSMQSEPGLTDQDVLLAVTTLSFDIAGLELFLPLITGAKVVVASQDITADGEALARCLETAQATIMQATPVTWRLLLEAGWTGKKNLTILCGGEALPLDLATQLAQCGKALWNLYGPTETTIWSMLAKIPPQPQTISLGAPIANTQIYVLDRHLQPVPPGVAGEICIGGEGLARGYHHRPDLTSDRFIDWSVDAAQPIRLYRTGDLGCSHADGRFTFLGRMDNQVKVRGFRIELGEIENRLAQHPNIDQAIVITRERSVGDQRLIAYFTSSCDSQLETHQLRAFLQDTLPDYMIPSQYIALPAFPLTLNGKIDRNALPHPNKLETTQPSVSVPPQTTLERQLMSVWEEVLGIRPIGIHDDFFALGGHSLLAVRLFERLKGLCGTQLPLATLFQAPTIAQLAALMQRDDWSPSWSSLVTISPRGHKSPLYCIHAHGGHVLFYHDLAKYLAPDQPVYGLQAKGLDDPQSRHTRVEDMAAHYIQEIQTLQPQGPYQLLGFCLGGHVAYEMAQQLAAQGQSIGLLALCDSNVTGGRLATLDTHSRRNHLRRKAQRARHYARALTHLKREDLGPYLSMKTQNVRTKLRRVMRDRLAHMPSLARRLPPDPDVDHQTENLDVEPYVPKPYLGHLTLFQASMQGAGFIHDPYLGWGELVSNDITNHVIPGYRETMFEQPGVREVAKILQAHLDHIHHSTSVKTDT